MRVSAARLHPPLLAWYDRERRDMPWRRTTDPYRVWVSEIMLQQTTVAAVTPKFERFVARFPDLAALAAAPLDDVLAAWSGLGYYRRARNLHRAAGVVVDELDGALPDEVAGLAALPGIGRYTAGAIASIAFGRAVPLIDANVARVLCRLFEVRGDPRSGPVERDLWARAGELVPAERPGDWNQALMELGARVCTPEEPGCDACPLAEACAARDAGVERELPELPPKAPYAEREDVSAIVRHPRDGRLLLVQRPAELVWGGLFETPRVERRKDEPLGWAAERAVAEATGLLAAAVEPATILGPIRHTVMRTRITLRGVVLTTRRRRLPADHGGFAPRWEPAASAAELALSSPQRRLLKLAGQRQPGLF